MQQEHSDGATEMNLYYQMICEVEDYAIVLLDTSGIVRSWNRGAEKIKGYTAQEIVGQSFSLFYPEKERSNNVPSALLREAATNGKVVYEGWRVRKDGTRFWGSIVITALHDDNGALTGFSKMTRDYSERKKAEDKLRLYAEQLEQKNFELEQFAFVAAHDLREPLRKIATYSERLVQDSTPAERRGEYYKRIHGASRRMAALIDNLLAFSGVGRNAEAPEELDLSAVVAEIVGDLEPAIEARNARISVGTLPVVVARASQMRQLFQNLIANSLKFNTKETPEVCIRAEQQSEDTRSGAAYNIYVEDNGIGFQQEHAEQIFGVFQRLHGRFEYEGTGLGLAICKKIVEGHNGTIRAHGVPGKGATFVIALPAPPGHPLLFQ